MTLTVEASSYEDWGEASDGLAQLFGGEELDTAAETIAGRTIQLKRIGSHAQHGENPALLLWPAARVLCEFIDAFPALFDGREACELGSGVGLCGIFLLLTGLCREVWLTDGDTSSIGILHHNLKLNSCSSYQLARLRWGQPADISEILGKRALRKFDVVMGSDLLYNPTCVEGLFQTAAALLSSSEDALFVQAFFLRSCVSEEDVVAAAARFSMNIEQIDLSTFLKQPNDTVLQRCRLWVFRHQDAQQ
eukprot:NODE_1281_length_930_cov_166.777526_g1061_i0.p1 GENE.NODE_1281_length_930_cov_166.777526_g1061_i0~~NODE_1281_length_930_cov_166.777526_g1061_i0.p1  ORF type:complete len:249 (+),score=26.04 NODE_1281_length_930_cov_166.777526_g1061_i0:81-827(+)